MRLDELQAAILLAKIKYLDKWNKKRKSLAKLYDSMLDCGISIRDSVYHLYPIQHKKRDKLKSYLEKSSVGTNIHYPVPLHRQNALKTSQVLPAAEKLCNSILSLPMFPELTEEEVGHVCDLINKLR